ncbi:MAG: cytochrome c family protein [Thermodesulfovibrio sp.]|nr:cytochrome c family protein [Thermodesulfovibrio sp.]
MRAIIVSAVVILCFLISYFYPISEVSSQDTKACFKCHSIKTLKKKLESAETLSLYVDKSKFESSVHGALDCSSCHPDISLKNHPTPKKIQSKRDYQRRISQNCLTCHPENALMKPQVHGKIVKSKEISCAECHGSHYIGSMKNWKKTVKVSQYCLACHKFEISKTLPSKEKISLKVSEEEIKRSVHKNFECIVCHSDFSKINHPIYNFKDKVHYRVEMTKICTKCHTDKELKKNPAHYAVAKTTPCIQCHGYHEVKSVKVVKTAPESQYCLNCHSRAISMKMKSGESLSVQVKESDLLASVHKKLKCSDCHKDFSPTQHPIRTFDSVAEYRAKAKEICNNCHKEEVGKYDKSIHAQALVKGNLQSPDCLKCHGYHTVAGIKTDRNLRMGLCAECHKKEMETFKLSIHHEAFLQGKQNAPVCSSCHNAHDVLTTNIAKISDLCIKCHKDVKSAHNKWLWNPPVRLSSFVDTHFASSSCASCHVKGQKAVYLTLYEKRKNKPFTLEEVAKILNIDLEKVKEKIDINKDKKVDSFELWQFIDALETKSDVKLVGRIDVIEPNEAHKIETKKVAVKDCDVCHNPKADFKGKLEINKEGAKPFRIDFDTKALNSAYAIPNISDFYVLGTTKIQILDILFLLALFGGIAVAVGHIALRALTAPIRRKRREGK